MPCGPMFQAIPIMLITGAGGLPGCAAGRLISAHPVLCFAVRGVRALCVAHHLAPSRWWPRMRVLFERPASISTGSPMVLPAALRPCWPPGGPRDPPYFGVMYSSDIQCLFLPQLSLLSCG